MAGRPRLIFYARTVVVRPGPILVCRESVAAALRVFEPWPIAACLDIFHFLEQGQLQPLRSGQPGVQ